MSEFPFIGLFALTATAGFFIRWFVRPRAPFYDPSNILMAGGSIGIGLSLLLSLLASETGLTGWRLMATHAFAIAAISFVGVAPDPIDWANKARQVGLVAGLAYAVCAFSIVLITFGSYFF